MAEAQSADKYDANQLPLKTPADGSMDEESVYSFYKDELVPAVLASFPILMQRLVKDVQAGLMLSFHKFVEFISPDWSSMKQTEWTEMFLELPQKTNISFPEFMLKQFDTNRDGHISAKELLNMTEILSRLPQAPQSPQNFWEWFSREWPLMDWKIGVFLWQTFGGMLLVLTLLSIVPGRLHSWSGKVLRWPILALTYFLIIVELMVYIVIRIFIRVAEILVATPKHRSQRRKMANAESYETWYQYAAALDISQKRDKWQRTTNDSTRFRYNWPLIEQLMEDLKTSRENNDSLLALAVLQQCTRKNVGGIMSEDMFSFTNTGEPKLIVKEFIDQVTETLHWITDEAIRLQPPEQMSSTSDVDAKAKYTKNLERKVHNEKDRIWKSLLSWATLNFADGDGPGVVRKPEIITRPRLSTADRSTGSGSDNEGVPARLPLFHQEQLVTFLKRARAAYGRTALCLSGGAMMGLYHFGHLQGLMETDSLPQIVSGTSAGSVVGALLCTRTNEELHRDLQPGIVGPKMKCFARPWLERFKSLWKNRCLFSGEEWLDMIKWFTCGDMTFEEAYQKTGRVFCITLASTTKKAPPVLLNHITAPNVTLASAVVASAAVPGFIKPVRLQAKDPSGKVFYAGEETYFDGSIETDIPVNGLAEQFNCQFFVAAQCNPHVVPFFFNAKGGVGFPSRWSSREQEGSWRGGFLLAALEMYLKNDMKAKFVFLHDLEAAVGFTSTMMVQEFVGSTTIVPQVQLADFFTVSLFLASGRSFDFGAIHVLVLIFFSLVLPLSYSQIRESKA